MLIEQALRTYLLAQSGLTALIGQRLYYGVAPQEVTLDTKTYIVMSKISGVREHSHDGGCGLAHPRFQFSIFAKSYNDAKLAAAQVQTALQGYSGTMGGGSGVVVNGVFYENEVDMGFEFETKRHHVAMDFVIWHRE